MPATLARSDGPNGLLLVKVVQDAMTFQHVFFERLKG